MLKTTYLLIILIIITVTFSLVRRNYFFASVQAGNQKNQKAERYAQAKRHFPTVDYNEPDLPDTAENRPKSEKQKRFNELGNWVSANPQSYIAENLAISEGYFSFPPLPVAKSDVVLIGFVGEAKAHLSENKKNVFSEFKVVVETAFKASNPEVKQGSVVTVNRMGGFVKYPNGQGILYRRSGLYMPKIGTRYLFFLNLLNKHDYGILTAYELTEAGVIPLDMATEVFVLEGRSETEIVRELRSLLLNTSN